MPLSVSLDVWLPIVRRNGESDMSLALALLDELAQGTRQPRLIVLPVDDLFMVVPLPHNKRKHAWKLTRDYRDVSNFPLHIKHVEDMVICDVN